MILDMVLKGEFKTEHEYSHLFCCGGGGLVSAGRLAADGGLIGPCLMGVYGGCCCGRGIMLGTGDDPTVGGGLKPGLC